MLKQLIIRDFVIVEQLQLDFDPGMTVVTGETGAGKSIMLNAIGLTLGNRADSSWVRQQASRCDISCSFDVDEVPLAQSWLQERQLDIEAECILRRTITSEGRSRGYINGQPVPLQDLKSLGALLIDIHSQHEHQSLLRRDSHRRLLDEFGQQQNQAAQVKQLFRQWRAKQEQLQALKDAADTRRDRANLIHYQVEELARLAPSTADFGQLEQEQQRLASAQDILAAGHQTLELCGIDQDLGALPGLKQAQQAISTINDQDAQLKESQDLLNEALINIQEAGTSLQGYLARVAIDPARLAEIDTRLADYLELARKHRCNATDLEPLHRELTNELADLEASEANLEQLENQLSEDWQAFMAGAQQLSKARAKSAKALEQAVNKQLKKLGMGTSRFQCQLQELKEEQINEQGLEQAQFMLAGDQGQALEIQKVASGGELSRLSLAIQVVTAHTSKLPTQIFDEVDVGIGGGTAEVVGSLLNRLSQRRQIICVTHQPQVASQGQQHLLVKKQQHKGQTGSQIQTLSGERRIKEIARMLGGLKITEQTLAHAREMLSMGCELVE